MSNGLHQVFFSYHHNNDQKYKDELISKFNKKAFIDMSVDTGDIDDDLPDQSIRRIIRDDYLSETSVTIVLVGTETKHRKHVDWEIYSSMYDGPINKKSGILIINLPTVKGSQISICNEDKDVLGWDQTWGPITTYERYDYLPKRLVDNIKSDNVRISIVNYERIINNLNGLKTLIDIANKKRTSNNYDLSAPMRRRDG